MKFQENEVYIPLNPTVKIVILFQQKAATILEKRNIIFGNKSTWIYIS